MKHLFIFFAFFFATIKDFAQSNLLFSKFQFDTSYQIIGLCPYEDNTRQYKDLTFLINDVSLLNKAYLTISYGQKIEKPPYEENSLELYVVKNQKILENYSVSPKYNNVFFYLNDSIPATFEFNLQGLLKISNVHPLNYSVKSLKFKSNVEFESFISTNKRNKNFLCYEDNTEDKDGKFSINIQGNANFKADAGWALIKAELKRITSNDKDYIISYTPNLTDLSKLTYYINTSKEIYDKFNLNKYPKGKWLANEIEILAYWKK